MEAEPAKAGLPPNVQPCDFRNPMLLAPGPVRKLKLHQEEFIQAVAARLSVHLRMEFWIKLSAIQTITYQKLAESWGHPAHLTMFKMEPLRGVSVLEISTQLGFCMVDRLMGGPGQAVADQEISEIEKVLLDQTGDLFLQEWCAHWLKVKELKPVILGYESNGRFIQAAPAETIMLVVSMEAGFGECSGKIQLGIPFVSMEPMLRSMGHGVESPPAAPVAPAASPAPALRWNSSLGEMPVTVTAQVEGLELTARQILALKAGDVLPLDPEILQRVKVRIADVVKFEGRSGACDGKWAVELTKIIKP